VMPGFKVFGRVVQPDDGGNVERARHDGRVRGAAPEISGNAEDTLTVHSRRVRWSEIVRDQNVRFRQGKKCFWRFALQIADDAPRHVFNVEGALGYIGMVNLASRLCLIGDDFLKSP